jgi:hypothetical protein
MPGHGKSGRAVALGRRPKRAISPDDDAAMEIVAAVVGVMMRSELMIRIASLGGPQDLMVSKSGLRGLRSTTVSPSHVP